MQGPPPEGQRPGRLGHRRLRPVPTLGHGFSATDLNDDAVALDEMAESIARRAVYRLRAVTNVVFPITVAALGSFVLLIASAMSLRLNGST